MKKVLFGVLTLGAAALVSASAVAVNRSIPATVISTYQDFNCFEKDAGDIRLKSSTSCRNKSLYTWLPVPVDPNSGAVLASVRRFKEGGSGCYDQDACIAVYTLDKDGRL